MGLLRVVAVHQTEGPALTTAIGNGQCGCDLAHEGVTHHVVIVYLLYYRDTCTIYSTGTCLHVHVHVEIRYYIVTIYSTGTYCTCNIEMQYYIVTIYSTGTCLLYKRCSIIWLLYIAQGHTCMYM